MNENRGFAASAQFGFNTGLWWITGGHNNLNVNGLKTTELYDAATNEFTPYFDLPTLLDEHNMVNINSTHMVVLGGGYATDQVFMFDRGYRFLYTVG